MKTRFLFIIFLLLISGLPALARLSGGVSQLASCVFTGSTTNLSCISPSNTSQFLTTTNADASHHSQQYSSNADLHCSPAAAFCFDYYQVAPPSGAPWFFIGASNLDRSVLCTGRTVPGSGAFINHVFPYGIGSFGKPDFWFMQFDFGGSMALYQVVPNCSSGPTKQFFNNTQAISYYRMADMCAAAHASDALEVKPAPAGIPMWLDGCDITVANVTITLDPGSITAALAGCQQTVAIICAEAANLTVIGPDATMGNANVNELINAYFPNGTGLTVQGSSGHYLTMDCGGGPPFIVSANLGVHAIETSKNDGLVTVSHVYSKGCGGGGNPGHSYYLTWGGGSTAVHDPAYCHNFTDVVAQDTLNGGWAFKFDDECGNAQGLATNISAFCSQAPLADGLECYSNAIVDFQCGGRHLVQNSYLEMYGLPILNNNDQWTFNKSFEGIYLNAGCPNAASAPAINTIRFDKDIFVLDGTASRNGIANEIIISCGAAGSGISGQCNANAGPDTSTTSSTSLTIGTGSQSLTIGTGFSGNSVSATAPLTITSSANSANNMSGFITSYNSSTGALVINIEAVNGSGTFASWNVKSPAHAAVCVTNSQIVGNYVNVPGHSVALVAGPGVFVDAGCTGSGADTNTYYGTSSAGTDDGRSLVCSASNWTAGSRTNCAFPFRPTFLTWETHDDLVQQAHDAGFCGAGTSSDPISECLPRLAMIEAGAAM